MTKSQGEIDRIFGKFSGREVKMKEKWRTTPTLAERFWAGNAWRMFFEPHMSVRPDWTDRTLLSMLFTAKAHGLKLFVTYPGHTMAWFEREEERDDRVRIAVTKGGDGKWRVHPKMAVY